MDWDNIWGQAKEGLANAWETGLPVIKASAEKELMNLLERQHAQTKEELQQVVSNVVNGPDTVAGSLVKNALFEEYKFHILAGVVLLVGVGFYMRR